ncbi:MAG TPA: M23 family metallopeptidase [Granulicella sp.]|jgi:murein DD-endopeptidase MepM/ murein hydrolase activator NlpD|nr:M23 family metallopeptidase [Granulicella sp.]
MRIVLALAIAIIFGTPALAQDITGSTTIQIDPSLHIVTATCETDLGSADDGYYAAQVICVVRDSSGIQQASGAYSDDGDRQGSAAVTLTFTGVPGGTYTAIGQHTAALTVPFDVPYGQPAMYFDELNFERYTESPQSYSYSYEWYGPGPEQTTQHKSLHIGNTMATATEVSNLTPIQHRYPGNPLPNACWVSQFFDKIGANATAHHAQDITNSDGNGSHSSPAYGTSVSAMESGTVTKIDGSEGPASPAYPACQGLRKLANTVWIQGNDLYTTRYVHVTPVPGLAVGQSVTQGQIIGTLDNSGCQSGAHLHVGRYPENGPAVNFSIPCVNAPTNQLWDGTVDDDDTAITP